MKINQLDVSNYSTNQLCELCKNKSELFKDKVNLEIIENGIRKTITLSKKQILPK